MTATMEPVALDDDGTRLTLIGQNRYGVEFYNVVCLGGTVLYTVTGCPQWGADSESRVYTVSRQTKQLREFDELVVFLKDLLATARARADRNDELDFLYGPAR